MLCHDSCACRKLQNACKTSWRVSLTVWDRRKARVSVSDGALNWNVVMWVMAKAVAHDGSGSRIGVSLRTHSPNTGSTSCTVGSDASGRDASQDHSLSRNAG